MLFFMYYENTKLCFHHAGPQALRDFIDAYFTLFNIALNCQSSIKSTLEDYLPQAI